MCPFPQGRDTKLIVSLSEGPKQFKVPLSQYKNYISYVLNMVKIILNVNETFNRV